MTAVRDLTGHRFGRLVVECRDGSIRAGAAWSCRCDCGGAVRVVGAKLSNGNTQSCGCLHREITSSRQQVNNRSHGMTGSAEYRTWNGIHQRCTNPARPGYRNYGGRGITICDRWLSFENFFADMGPKPKGLSIERDDNDGPYEPGNCRWATAKEQSRNRRVTRFIETPQGPMMFSEACKVAGMTHRALDARLRAGWTVEEAMTRPKRPGTPLDNRR